MNVILTVGGVPFEELESTRREHTMDFVTNEVEKIISQSVVDMINKGKSLEDIKKYLKIN